VEERESGGTPERAAKKTAPSTDTMRRKFEKESEQNRTETKSGGSGQQDQNHEGGEEKLILETTFSNCRRNKRRSHQK